LVQKNFKLSTKHIFFFIPFLAYVFLTLTYVTSQDIVTIQKLATLGYFLSLPTYFILYSILRISNLVLAALSLIAIFRYRKSLYQANQSVANFDVNMQLIILSGFSVVFIFEGTNYVYFYFINKLHFLVLWDAVPFVKFVIFNTLIFTGLKNSSIFEANEIRMKYGKSQLVNDEKEILLEKLKEFMLKEKYFLTPSITLQDVAEKMNEQPRYISQVINELLGQNFIDFVNSYRIEEAKKLLIDSKFQHYSIHGIMLEVGFNSKSAFNNAFKKQTGFTPSEYKFVNNKKTSPE
jgi:AraC-like DNA-binding protein